MRHCVNLFVGEGLQAVALDVKKYVLKYGEESYSPYFKSLHWKETEQAIEVRCCSKVESDESVFVSGVEDEYMADFSLPTTFEGKQDSDKIQSYFDDLYQQTVTKDCHGDSTALLLTIFFPLFDAGASDCLKCIVDNINAISAPYKLDIVGLCPDLAHVFLDVDALEVLRKQRSENLKITKENIKQFVEIKSGGNNIGNIIVMQNCCEDGVSLDLNYDSFVRIMGEFAMLCVESYNQVFNPASIEPNYPITAFGSSVIDFDKFYFAQYLLRKAYLYVMSREKIEQDKVDVNKVATISQEVLKKRVHAFGDFYENEIKPLIQQNIDQNSIINTITPKLESLYKDIETEFISYINDEKLSLPEKKATLAQLLGIDDELLSGNVFLSDLYAIEDIDIEAMNVFVEANNSCVTGAMQRGESFQSVINTPVDKDGKVYIPINELKKLKAQMRESTEYIRRKSKELNDMSVTLHQKNESEKRLTEEGFVFNGIVYKLLDPSVEDVLFEDNYNPKPVTRRNYSLKYGFSRIKDQKELGACTAFAVTSVFEYLLKKINNKEEDLSEAYVYYNSRMKRGNELVDSGSTCYDAIESVSEFGICSESLCPYDVQMFSQKPSDEAYQDARKRLIKTAKNVRVAVDDIKSAINEGFPVIISLRVYDSFDAPNGFVTRPSEEEVLSGRYKKHAVTICGFSDAERVFLVRNSWGKGFGKGGYFYIPYSYADGSEECMINYACTITNIQYENTVSTQIPATQLGTMIIEFDQTDIAVRAAIIQNLIDEEKYSLRKREKEYFNLKICYESLVQLLGNNSNRRSISDAAKVNLDKEIERETSDYNDMINKKRPGDIKAFKRATNIMGLWLGGAAVLLFMAYCSMFLVSNFRYNWIFVILSALATVLLILWLSWRKTGLKRKEKDWNDCIGQKNVEINRMKEMLDVVKLKHQVAGMMLDKSFQVQTNLTNKYHQFNSYLGNLKIWQKEEKEKIDGMKPHTRFPFSSIISNNQLDAFFDQEVGNLTESIWLYKYLEDYELNDSCLIAYKNRIKKLIKDMLLKQADDFDMCGFLSGNVSYAFVCQLSDVKPIISDLDRKSMVFTQFLQTKPTDISKQLFVNVDANAMVSWGNTIKPYFLTSISSNSITATNKVVFVQNKQLKLDELKVME